MIYVITPGGTRERGGMGRIVSNFTSDLRQHRPDLRIEVLDTYGPDKFRLMPFYFAAAILRLGFRLIAGRADLLHIHMAEYGSVVRKGLIVLLASLFRVPVVLHLHGGRLPEQMRAASPPVRWAIRRMVSLCSEVVVLGDYWRRFVHDAFGADAPPVTVLPNAVPGPPAVPPRAAGGPVRILFLGRLIPLKGVDVLLNALATPACRERAWELVIAGDGDEETYRRQAEALGLSDRVRFTGWLGRDDCHRLLSQSDVLVQPSRFEALPMSVLEAMAYRMAIVATPVGSVGDVVEHDVTGLLVPAGDVQPLAEALVHVIDDAALRGRLGTAARIRFETNFEMSIYRERLIDIYRRNARTWAAASLAADRATQPKSPVAGSLRFLSARR